MNIHNQFLRVYAEAEKSPQQFRNHVNENTLRTDQEAVSTLVELYKGEAFDLTVNYMEGVVRSLVLMNDDTPVFYEKLYNSIFNSSIGFDEVQRQCCFFLASVSPLLPYEHVDVVSMNDDEYLARREANAEKIERITRLANRPFSQKTENASAVMDIVDSTDNRDDKAILFSAAIDAFQSLVPLPQR